MFNQKVAMFKKNISIQSPACIKDLFSILDVLYNESTFSFLLKRYLYLFSQLLTLVGKYALNNHLWMLKETQNLNRTFIQGQLNFKIEYNFF